MSDLSRLIRITKIQKQLVTGSLLKNNSMIQKMKLQSEQLKKFADDYRLENLPSKISVDQIIYSSHFRNKLLQNLDVLSKDISGIENKNIALIQRTLKLDKILEYLSDRLFKESEKKSDKITTYESSQVIDILLNYHDVGCKNN